MTRRPPRIDPELTARLLNVFLPMLGMPKPEGWRVYAVNSRRGRCSNRRKIITVPKWAFESPTRFYHLTVKDPAMFPLYYLAHELAHVSGGPTHGPAFMAAFKVICPPSLQYLELGYKPRAAAAAGIG